MNAIVKDSVASYRVFDPHGSRQMDMPACPLGSLLAGINSLRRERLMGVPFLLPRQPSRRQKRRNHEPKKKRNYPQI